MVVSVDKVFLHLQMTNSSPTEQNKKSEICFSSSPFPVCVRLSLFRSFVLLLSWNEVDHFSAPFNLQRCRLISSLLFLLQIVSVDTSTELLQVAIGIGKYRSVHNCIATIKIASLKSLKNMSILIFFQFKYIVTYCSVYFNNDNLIYILRF